MMKSRDRMLAAIRHQQPDRVPLYAWAFGFRAPEHLRWSTAGRPAEYWYTKRLEHIHTLPQPWTLDDDFKRVDAWLSLGVDDVLEVSVPWGCDPRVSAHDSVVPAGAQGNAHPLLVREYHTPDGDVRHAVQQTGEQTPPGWVIQPEGVPLFEDFNIPRAVHHLVNGPDDVARVKWLYQAPDAAQRAWLAGRMSQVAPFAADRGVLTQAWSAFGVDAVVWLAGVENAVMLCMEHPDAFDTLLDIVDAADQARTALALDHGADMAVQRGWYSSIDFWSPRIFRKHFKPRIAALADLAHSKGKLFAFTMTTGVAALGPDLMDAGVDLLYYADPAQDRLDLGWAQRTFAKRMAVAGGINTSLTLTPNDPAEIRAAVRSALDCFGKDGGFILSPVDALFPDTPWSAVEAMIEAWREGVISK
jgi:hypothetical protein